MTDYKILRTYLNNDISQLDLFENRINELADDGYKVISTDVQNSMYIVMMEKSKYNLTFDVETISPNTFTTYNGIDEEGNGISGGIIIRNDSDDEVE
jgi:hypothetical protein